MVGENKNEFAMSQHNHDFTKCELSGLNHRVNAWLHSPWRLKIS